MLQSYYDINSKDKFTEIFRDTWIVNNPTPERNKYLVMKFNFSGISKDSDNIESNFNNYCNDVINNFIKYYTDYIPESLVTKISNTNVAHEKIYYLANGLIGSEPKLYVIIDEYDNFANALLTQQYTEVYQQMAAESGFFKQFFTNLKLATTGSGSLVAKTFITGVSPITMDDVASGFNISKNISILPAYNNILGFTEAEVQEMMEYYFSGTGTNILDALKIMQAWYDNYIFSDMAKETVFNTDAVLYFISETNEYNKMPLLLVDDNLRMDYQRLRYLVLQDKKLNGNFNVLSEIINNGEIVVDFKKSFPFDRMTDRDNFISFLYFLGLLTFTNKTKFNRVYLTIPNETIKQLIYEYISDALFNTNNIFIDLDKFGEYLIEMTSDGNFKNAFTFVAKEIERLTSIRDFINGEVVPKLFYHIYFGRSIIYQVLSEKEVNKTFPDLVLVPNNDLFKDIKYAYLIEFKYLTRKLKGKQLKTEIEKIRQEAEKQINEYAQKEKLKQMLKIPPFGEIYLKKIVVIFNGWDMVYCEEA
jgi:hypothetical protein